MYMWKEKSSIKAPSAHGLRMNITGEVLQNTHLRIHSKFKQKIQGKSEEAAKKKVDLEIKCMVGVGVIKATTA